MSRNDIKGQLEPQTFAGLDRENRANSSTSFQPLGSRSSQPAGNFARRSNIWSGASLNQQASASGQNSGAVDSDGAQRGDRSDQATSYTRPARQPFGGPSAQDLSVPRGSHTPWGSYQTNVWASNDPSSPFNVASWRRPSAHNAQAPSPSDPATIQTSSHERTSTGWSQPQADHSTLLASLPRLNTHSTVVDARPLGLPQRASASANNSRGLPPSLGRQLSQPQSETQRAQLSASHVFQPFDHSLSQGLANPYAGRIGHASATNLVFPSSNVAELNYDMDRMRVAQLEQGLDMRGMRRTSLEYSALARQSNGVVPESRLLQNEAYTSAGQSAWSDGRHMASQHGRLVGLTNGNEYTWSPMHQAEFSTQQMNQQGHQLHQNLHGLAIQGAPMPDDTTQASVRASGNGSARDYLTGLPAYLPMDAQQRQLQAHIQQFRERQALPQMSISSRASSSNQQAHLRRPSPASEDTVTPLQGTHIVADSVAGASEAATLTTSLRSKVLEAYKSNPKANPRAGRPWEIKDIYDHVVEFAGDQNGSRFIQTRLESANSEEKERVFREIQPNAVQLTMDVFGNYVIQKLFEYGDQNQKSILVNQMRGQVLSLSLQTYACRVVQTALRYVLVEQQAIMVRELEREVLRCVRDQNGNHVIQKAIECCRHSDITFVIASFIGQLHQLSIHQYGCRVVQRLLERCDDYWKSILLQEIFTCAGTLITDPFGNYVAQNVIEQGGPQGKAHMFQLIKDNFEAYSKQKYSSNVVEHMLKFCSPEHHRELVLMMLRTEHGSEMPLSILLRDQYGNYVIQRTLNTISERDFYPFVDILAAEMAKWKKFMPAKNYEMVLKHMNRFPPRPSSRRSRVLVPLPPLHTSQPEPPSTPTPALTSSERGSTPRSSSIPSTIADESPSQVTGHKGGDVLGQEIEFTLSEH